MKKISNQWTFWLIIATFTTPLLLAFVLYYSGQLTSMAKTAHGQLLPQPQLFTELLSQTNIKNIPNQWLLVYIAPQVCDANCEKKTFLLRQVHIALGKDAKRVTRLILAQKIKDAFGAQILPLTENEQKKLMQVAVISLQPGSLLLVDPHSNIVMYYPPDFAERDLLKDLQHLLKLSHIG